MIEAVEGEIFGKVIHSELYEKAGMYMFTIISNHIFQDGNKRTGLESALIVFKIKWLSIKRSVIENQIRYKRDTKERRDNQSNFYTILP